MYGRLFILLTFHFERRRKASIKEKCKEMRIIANGKAKGQYFNIIIQHQEFLYAENFVSSCLVGMSHEIRSSPQRL
jgi:hypothetical protein